MGRHPSSEDGASRVGWQDQVVTDDLCVGGVFTSSATVSHRIGPGYVAGSLVTLVSTHHAVERRAIRNLFGVLPRKKIVVHVVPHWVEWLLALIVGFLVMEAVRYWFKDRKPRC